MPSPAVSDAQLIARVLVNDDRHAFGELVRRHQSAVRATLRKLAGGNHALAEDLAQETFLLAYRNLRSFRQEAKFSTWLYRIAYSRFLMQARKRKPDEPLDDWDGTTPSSEGQAQARIDLERAMKKLAPAESAALTLCFALGLSNTEAADTMQIPLGTLKSHVLRGREKLKVILGDQS